MPKIIRKHVDLTEDHVRWFYDTYGNAANKPSLSWLLDLLLEKFRESHDRTPEELAHIGAAELKRLLQERVT